MSSSNEMSKVPGTSAYDNLGLSAKTQTQKESSDQVLGQKDFLKLMTAQMQNQDPFSPMENADFVAQMAQFSTVTGIDQVNDTLENLSDQFVAKIKHVLEGNVANVRSSANMETSLARLVADDNGMDQQMERMMRMHNPDFKGMPKVLEVNAKHPLIKSLNAKLEAGEFEGSDDFAKLILDSALVAEGEAIIDPRDFAKRLSDVMQKALAS